MVTTVLHGYGGVEHCSIDNDLCLLIDKGALFILLFLQQSNQEYSCPKKGIVDTQKCPECIMDSSIIFLPSR
jgi:hypothetical protein